MQVSNLQAVKDAQASQHGTGGTWPLFCDVDAMAPPWQESFIEMEMEGLGPVPSNMTEARP